jgi:hypothetical protein
MRAFFCLLIDAVFFRASSRASLAPTEDPPLAGSSLARERASTDNTPFIEWKPGTPALQAE